MAHHPRLTVGAIRFADWLKGQPSQEAAAKKLGISQQQASRIALGRRVPRSHDLVEKIREVVGIDPGTWRSHSRRPVPPVKPRPQRSSSKAA